MRADWCTELLVCGSGFIFHVIFLIYPLETFAKNARDIKKFSSFELPVTLGVTNFGDFSPWH